MENKLPRITLMVGQVFRTVLPYSEVCMHMRIAGTPKLVCVLSRSAQILNDDGTPFSFPVSHGEAGIYDTSGSWYAYGEKLNVGVSEHA